MADTRPVVYSWAMESEREQAVKVVTPVGSMATRVAELWREQGEEFLEQTHADVEIDLTRLRNTITEEPEDEPDRAHRLAAGVESTVHRLSEWDHAVMEGLRSWRADKPRGRGVRNRQQQLLDDVVDLRRPEPLVDLTHDQPEVVEGASWCAKHGNHPAEAVCRKCHESFCDDFVLRPGAHVAPLCLDCALVLSGIRHRH